MVQVVSWGEWGWDPKALAGPWDLVQAEAPVSVRQHRRPAFR